MVVNVEVAAPELVAQNVGLRSTGKSHRPSRPRCELRKRVVDDEQLRDAFAVLDVADQHEEEPVGLLREQVLGAGQ